MIDKDIPHVLIDIRPSEAAENEHIKGTVNIALKDLAGEQDRFPKDKKAPIIVYCNENKLSQDGFRIIRKWGYSNVTYLDGGIGEWKKAGYAVESGGLKTAIVYEAKPLPGEIVPADFIKIASARTPEKFILDVRDLDEAAEGMIKGAINIPTQHIESRLAEIPKEKEIIIHCSTGTRAEITYNVLKEKGYRARYLNATIDIAKDGTYKITKE